MNKAIVFVRLLVGLLPASKAKNRLMSVTGPTWCVALSARVGPNLFWGVDELSVGQNASLGAVNIFRDLRSVSIGDGAAIGQLNWFSAAARIAPDGDQSVYRSFVLGELAAVVARHYLDCSGGIVVGAQSTIAGVRSTLMSHAPDLRAGKMRAQPIRIGTQCFISANVTVISGTRITDRVVVGAGSVVSNDLLEPDTTYAGSPARRVAEMSGAAYFRRPGMRIDPRSS